MVTGEFYRPVDTELVADLKSAERLLATYNVTPGKPPSARFALLRLLPGAAGEGTVIQPVFACDYGYNIRLCRNVPASVPSVGPPQRHRGIPPRDGALRARPDRVSLPSPPP